MTAKRVPVRSFRELSDELDRQPGIDSLRAEADAELTAELVAYSLGELREQVAVTQSVLASRLGIKQPSVSALEHQGDMLLSTLRNTIEALGGELSITVRFPGIEGAAPFRLLLDEQPPERPPASEAESVTKATSPKKSARTKTSRTTKRTTAPGGRSAPDKRSAKRAAG
jgi:transcriptional regulator with XRE-family HTH domain